MVAIFNYFQAGLVLYSDGLLTREQVNELALNMIQEGEYDALRLANSFQDIVRRLHLPLDKMNALLQFFHDRIAILITSILVIVCEALEPTGQKHFE